MNKKIKTHKKRGNEMEAIKCIETRRSIRKFKDTKISHEVMEEIVKAASYAPSWKNTQITRYVVVESDALKSKIANEGVLGFTYNTGTIETVSYTHLTLPTMAVV